MINSGKTAQPRVYTEYLKILEGRINPSSRITEAPHREV